MIYKKRKLNQKHLILSLMLIVALIIGGYFGYQHFFQNKYPNPVLELETQQRDAGKRQRRYEADDLKIIDAFYPEINSVSNKIINHFIDQEINKFKAMETTNKRWLLFDYESFNVSDIYYSVALYQAEGEDQNTLSYQLVKTFVFDHKGEVVGLNKVFEGDYIKQLAALARQKFKTNNLSSDYFKTLTNQAEAYSHYCFTSDSLRLYFPAEKLYQDQTGFVSQDIAIADMAYFLVTDYPGTEVIKKTSENQVHVRYIDATKPMVALTFDDGPGGKSTDKVLEILDQYQSKATFFLLGKNVETGQDKVKKMVASGHQLGNHSWNHPDLTRLSAEEIRKQIDQTNEVIKTYAGEAPTIVRVPYGAINNLVKQEVKYPLINWNIDTLDWKTRNAQKTYDHVMSHVHDGSIVLMHDIHAPTADAVALLVPALIEKGYQLVTIEEMMLIKGIDLNPGQVYFNS